MNSRVGSTMPKLPVTGSSSAQAISFPCREKASSSFSVSLYGMEMTSCATPRGTPRLSSIPRVEEPDPAETSTGSECPWYAPSNLRIFSLPVYPRATRRAVITASVPEAVKRTSSI